MKNGLLVLTIFFVLAGCKKLQEKRIKLDTFCPECADTLRDSVNNLPGVHFVLVNGEESSLLFKYDTAVFSMRRLNTLLIKEGYLKNNQDSVQQETPGCCNRQITN